MKLADFNAKGEKDQKKLKKKLENFKLEKVLSLWYLIRSTSKATILGSKN